VEIQIFIDDIGDTLRVRFPGSICFVHSREAIDPGLNVIPPVFEAFLILRSNWDEASGVDESKIGMKESTGTPSTLLLEARDQEPEAAAMSQGLRS
jgi:hypothetical protein